MDNLFNKLQNESKGDIYNKLAPLYDFIYRQHYDYENQKDLIDKVSTENTKTILEGACGTGQLTKYLIKDYDNVISVDYSDGMISKARDNVPEGNYIHADLEGLELNTSVDLYSILGSSIIHLTGDEEFKNVASNAYDCLKDGGKFVFDFMSEQDIKNGATGESVFKNDNYTVTRKYLTTKSDSNLYRFNFAFEIHNNQTGEEVKTSDSIPVKGFEVKDIKNTLEDIGFKDIHFTSMPEHEYGSELTNYFVATK